MKEGRIEEIKEVGSSVMVGAVPTEVEKTMHGNGHASQGAKLEANVKFFSKSDQMNIKIVKWHSSVCPMLRKGNLAKLDGIRTKPIFHEGKFSIFSTGAWNIE